MKQSKESHLRFEAENFVYVTGLFIRLAIQSENL